MLWMLGGVGQGGLTLLGCLKKDAWEQEAPLAASGPAAGAKLLVSTSAAHRLMPAD